MNAVCIHSAFCWLSLEFPFESGNKDGVDSHHESSEVVGWFWEAMWRYEENWSPGSCHLQDVQELAHIS